MAKRILALEKDLFFSVKIRDTLKHHGYEVAIARNLAGFSQQLAATDTERPLLAIINIGIQGVDWGAAIREAHEHGLPILAFGSHMDLEARKLALEAGARRVVANSKFSSDMPGLVQRLISEPSSAPTEEENDDKEA